MDSTQLNATAIGPQSPEPFQHVCFEGDEPNVFSWGLFWLLKDVQSESGVLSVFLGSHSSAASVAPPGQEGPSRDQCGAPGGETRLQTLFFFQVEIRCVGSTGYILLPVLRTFSFFWPSWFYLGCKLV